jgi:hypothetical protein
MPLTNDGRDWHRVNIMLAEAGVVRGERTRAPTGQTYVLILDRDPRYMMEFPATAKKECSRVLAQFPPKEFK